MSPEELWKDAVKGSQDAWANLFSLFGSKIYQFFLKNTADPELSMDKSQEVFEKLFRHKESFVSGSLKVWIFHIAKNLLIDFWRRGKKKEVLFSEPPNVPDPALEVEEQVLKKLRRDEIMKLIDETFGELIEEDKVLVGLVYLGNLSFPELAEVMEIPLGTAKTRTRQARIRLEQLVTRNLGSTEARKSI